MKNTVLALVIISLIFAISSCSLPIVSQNGAQNSYQNPERHVCEFTKRSTEFEYFKSSATCEAAAVYYYSCACGKSGDDTFYYGSPEPHDYSLEIVDQKYFAS